MRSLFLALAGFVFLIGTISCSGSSNSGTIDERDSAAYGLGREHGESLIAIHADSIAVREALLEIRAQESYIERHFRKSASNAYIQGFTDAVKSGNDSLAKILF